MRRNSRGSVWPAFGRYTELSLYSICVPFKVARGILDPANLLTTGKFNSHIKAVAWGPEF